jgi:CHAT domain-containing protein
LKFGAAKAFLQQDLPLTAIEMTRACRNDMRKIPQGLFANQVARFTNASLIIEAQALLRLPYSTELRADWVRIIATVNQDKSINTTTKNRLLARTYLMHGRAMYDASQFTEALGKYLMARELALELTDNQLENEILLAKASGFSAQARSQLGEYTAAVRDIRSAMHRIERLQLLDGTPTLTFLPQIHTTLARCATSISNPSLLSEFLPHIEKQLASSFPQTNSQCFQYLYTSLCIASAADSLDVPVHVPSLIRRAVERTHSRLGEYSPEMLAIAQLLLASAELRGGRIDAAEFVLAELAATNSVTTPEFVVKSLVIRSEVAARRGNIPKAIHLARKCVELPSHPSVSKMDQVLALRLVQLLSSTISENQEAVDYGQQAYDLYMEHLKDLASETNSAEFHRKRQAARIILNDLLADGIVARTNPATLARAVRRFYQTDFAVRVAGEDQHQQLMLRRADLELIWQTTLLQSVLPNIGVKQTQETLKEIAQLERGTLFIPSVPPGDLTTPDRPAWLLHRMPHGDLDWLLLFHPTADGGTRLAVIDAGPFMEKLQSWRRKTIDHQDADEDLQWLSRQLQSVFAQLPTKISITGDPLVYEIPWAALWVDERRLIERAAIEVAERPQAGDPTIELTRSSSACLIGDVHFPDNATLMRLPFSGEEVTQVARYFDKPQLGLKRVPNRSWVLEQLAKADIAHFATHGIGRSTVRNLGQGDSPLLAKAPFLGSGLLIASESSQQADLLTAATVSQLHLPQLKLVVLSACESAVGAGDEPGFALPRAFHLAGAQTVVSTQWPVDDQATSVLMKLFYANLLDEKMQPAEAVRQAQLTVYHHPQQLSRLAQMRGPDFSKAAQKLRRVKTTDGNEPHASPRLWAGFLVSRRR